MAKKKMPLAAPPRDELVEVLLKALSQTDAPITAAGLQKNLSGPYRRPPDELAGLLEEQLAVGRVFRFSPSRGKRVTRSRRPKHTPSG